MEKEKMERKNRPGVYSIFVELNQEQYTKVKKIKEETGQTYKALLISKLCDTPVLNAEGLQCALGISEEYEKITNFPRKQVEKIDSILDNIENKNYDEVIRELKSMKENAERFECEEEEKWQSLRSWISHHRVNAA